MSARTSVTVSLLCASLALGACSGGGGGAPTPASTVTTPATPQTPATGTPTSGPATPGPVTINDSGSTNSKAFTVILSFSGMATITQNQSDGGGGTASSGTTTTATVPSSSTAQLFNDLAANVPVSMLGAIDCPKSASFGTATIVTFRGASSGDLSCSGSGSGGSPTQKVFGDVTSVENTIGLSP